MSMAFAVTSLQEKEIEALKRLEGFSFQVAMYLLGDEMLAAEAAKRSLLEAARTSAFLSGRADEQREMIKRFAAKHAISVKRKSE